MFSLTIQAFEQSLIFFPLAIGIYISYAILRTTDLTVDGSFVLGAAVFAKFMTLQVDPVICLLLATLAGALAGVGVSLIQRGNRIHPLIAGILAVFILNSLNLQIMGRPNISLLNQETVLTKVSSLFSFLPLHIAPIGSFLLISLLACGAISLLISSRLGLALRAFGDNRILLQLLSKKVEIYRMTGLALSNALVAFCGSMTAQANGYADTGMGFGLVLVGIGTVVIGMQLLSYVFKERSPPPIAQLTFCFIGVLIYFLTMNIFLKLGVNPINLRLMIGISLVVFLAATGQVKRLGGVSEAQ